MEGLEKQTIKQDCGQVHFYRTRKETMNHWHKSHMSKAFVMHIVLVFKRNVGIGVFSR